MPSDGKVGFKRPPKSTQFQKGQSGNPKGRPKGTKNIRTDLAEELSETIKVREGERSLKISKQRAFIKTLMAKTLKGDGRAAQTLLNLMFRVLEVDQNPADADQPLDSRESEVMEALTERLLRSRKPVNSITRKRRIRRETC